VALLLLKWRVWFGTALPLLWDTEELLKKGSIQLMRYCAFDVSIHEESK
jgi:hypothetical protein